jgi:hypothetical protein
MQDEEYPTYLKKQAYDDLVAISCSVDKESQAKRYEMVLAEIAERDRRGEKPKANWPVNTTLVLGVFFIFEFVMDLILSRTGWRPIIHLAFGIICLVTAWVSRKKGKDEKPAA